MTKRWRRWCGVLLLLPAVPGAPGATAALHAQERVPAPSVGLVAGAFSYELDGEGTVPLVGLRLDLPLARYVAVEARFQFAEYQAVIPQDDGSVEKPHVPLLMGDFQFQGRYPVWRVTPYLGAGAGGVVDFRDDRQDRKFVDLTFTASGGFLVPITERLEAMGELRLRGIGDVRVDVIEAVAGVSLSF